VFAIGGDPIAPGLVTSLSRPAHWKLGVEAADLAAYIAPPSIRASEALAGKLQRELALRDQSR